MAESRNGRGRVKVDMGLRSMRMAGKAKDVSNLLNQMVEVYGPEATLKDILAKRKVEGVRGE